MGLGAPKRRNKLSHDPNNTAWSRSTTNFGHRILSQHGWQPGQYLGAENANHGDHYTAANASHIRVLLREDNLGLGAKVGGNRAETFGLSLFSGVLGRLNGRSDDQVQKQQHALRDAELRQYQVGKYGMMNFVSGGLLVGDRIQKAGEESSARDVKVKVEDDDRSRADKKRKVEEDSEEEKTSKKKTRRHIKTEAETDEVADLPSALDVPATEQIGRKDKREKKARKPESDAPPDTAATEKKSKKRREKSVDKDTASTAVSADGKSRLKQEKRARKEDRRKRKEARRLKKAAKESRQAEAKTQPAPAAQGGGRHAVRHRYIQQKRMAGMDAQAMKEIFMVKATA